MSSSTIIPVAMTIAGSDSSGGAGIQADLRAFNYFGVYGASAITALTAQNPNEVLQVTPVEKDMVSAQIRAVNKSLRVKAFKTGMLFSKDIMINVARGIVEARNSHPDEYVPLVVDPVMIATSGARLIDDAAVETLCQLVLPLATVITPNIPELAVLAGLHHLESVVDILEAGQKISAKYETAVLIKGGHTGEESAVDYLCQNGAVRPYQLPRLKEVKSSHGSGCSLSAAIAALLAKGMELELAVAEAKNYVFESLQNAQLLAPDVAGMWPKWPERLTAGAIL